MATSGQSGTPAAGSTIQTPSTGRGGSAGPLADDADPQAVADGRVVVPHREVLGAPVVPQRHRVGRPPESALVVRILEVSEQHVQHGPALVGGQAPNAGGEGPVDVQGL